MTTATTINDLLATASNPEAVVEGWYKAAQDSARLRAELDRNQAETGELRADRNLARTELARLVDELDGGKLAVEQVEALRQERAELRRRLSTIEEAAARREVDIERLSRQLGSASNIVTELEAERNDLARQFAAAQQAITTHEAASQKVEEKHNRPIRVALVVAALCSAAVSFAATAAMADSHKVASGVLAFLVPIGIEIVGGLALWARNVPGRHRSLAAVTAVTFIGLAMVINIAHSDGSLLGGMIAGSMPLGLVLGVEILSLMSDKSERQGSASPKSGPTQGWQR